MDSTRWTEIQSLFQSSLRLDPAERVRFLEQECQGNQALLREIFGLLEAFDSSGEFLSKLTFPGLKGTADRISREEWTGRHLGPYQILERIGTGGMGSVFLAERVDGAFDLKVAIKSLRVDLDRPAIVERFSIERKILARLNHPHIARLLDGGTTPDGISYVVMEYVEGIPIDEYCDTHRLSQADRLRLFVKVCFAVHYAHQNLVVHRDLKPANILVTDEGEVKLLGTSKGT